MLTLKPLVTGYETRESLLPTPPPGPKDAEPGTAPEDSKLDDRTKAAKVLGVLEDAYATGMIVAPGFLTSPYLYNFTLQQSAYLKHHATEQVRAAKAWLEEVRDKVNHKFSIQVTESRLQLVPKPEPEEDHFADLDKEEQHDRTILLRNILDDLDDDNGHPCPTFEALANAIKAYLAGDLETPYSMVIRQAHVACKIHISLHYPITLTEHNLAEFLKGRSGHGLTPFLKKLGFETLEAHVYATPRFQIASQEAKEAWVTHVQIVQFLAQAGNYKGCHPSLATLERELAWELPESVVELAGVVGSDEISDLMWDEFGPHLWPFLVPG